jgi:hypothetical protein
MTCIVAGKGWMAADRRITSEDGAASSLVKIAKSKHLIAAASGNATSTLDVRRAVRKGALSPDDLIEHVDKDSYALVLLPSGDVHRIEAGRVWPAEQGLAAIGSGGDLALGWLLCRESLGLGVDKDEIRRAVRLVEKKRSDCGGGVDVRFFVG